MKFVSNQVRQLARNAVTVRYFGAACGNNLPGQGVIDDIRGAMLS
jgi:hypothetical protein